MSFVCIKHQAVFQLARGGGSLPAIMVKVTVFHAEAAAVRLSHCLPSSGFAKGQLRSRMESPSLAQLRMPRAQRTLCCLEVAAVDMPVDVQGKP